MDTPSSFVPVAFLRIVSPVSRLCFGTVAFVVAVLAAQRADAQVFVHPGGLHTQADLGRMKAQVAAGAHPWIDDWNLMITDSQAQNTYSASPQANMGVSRQRASADAHAAYLNAIRWYVSGDTSYADCAVRICNGWSAAVNQVPTGTDIPGLIGIPIAEFAYVGEVLRLYPGWASSDMQRFQTMMETYLYPVCHNFLTNHNGTCDTHYWANWDICNIGAIMAIGVFCDDAAKFNEAVQYYQTGVGNGNILNAVYYIHPNGLGQWQESGRDQEHAQLGVGMAAAFCQMAWNQGVDLFGLSNNRLLAGAEYVARTTLNQPVPYVTYNNCDNVNQYFLASNGLGRLDDRPIWELLYNHYVVQQGLSAPNISALVKLTRPERGSADHFGYGTLTFTLNGASSPFPALPVPAAPAGVAATGGVGYVALSWNVPSDNSAAGYVIQRATAAAGPFTTIATVSATTWNQYSDSSVTAGTTYYYTVTETNRTGTGAASSVVSATPIAATGALPAGWASQDIGVVSAAGSASYGNAMGNTFVVSGSGTGIGGASDSCGFTGAAVSGDVVLVARLYGAGGTWSKTGLMVRESLAPDAPMIVMKLGDAGAREAGAGVRSATGGATTWSAGDDYTWLPAWFKVERSGNTFTASQSADGVNWITVTTVSIPMANTVYAGLVACSGSSTGALLTSSFDNVTLNGVVLAGPPANLTAVNGQSQVTLAWAASANATSYNVKRATTSGGPYTTIALGVTGTSYVDGGLTNWTTYYYVVTAVEGSFESANSSEVAGTPGDITDLWNSTPSSGNWSVGSNWAGGVAPKNGVSLALGSSSVTALTNDIGGLVVNRITFNSGAPAFTIAGSAIAVGGTIRNNSSATEVISAPLALNGTQTISSATGAVTLSGVVSDGSALSGIVKAGTQPLSLTGQSTFTGDVIHSAGSLTIAGVGAGTAGAPTSGALGRGTLRLSGGALTSSAAATVYNNIVLQAGTTSSVGSPSANLTLAGNISGSGNLNESGSNTGGTHFNGNNSGFTGTFSSSNATSHRVRFNVATAGSANATWILNNSQTDGYGLTFGNATISFGALSGNGVFRNDSAASTSLSIISIGALNTDTTFGGVMVANSGRAIGVTKVGTGTLTFTGAQTYNGPTTITSGGLLINGSIASAVSVSAGTFGGTGRSTASVTVGTGVGTGATLAPGNRGIGTFTTTGALTLNADATYAVEINSTTATADKVSAASVTINNAALTITDLGSGALPYGTTFTIVDNSGAGVVTGTFSGLPEGALVSGGANLFRISYQGGTGNDVVLTAVEPPPAVTSAGSASGTVGAPFSYTLSGSNSPTTFGASGLPAGLSIDPATGIISGTPTTAGTSNATVTVANSTASGSAPLTIVVAKGAATVTLTGLAQTYSGSPTAVGVSTSPAGLAVAVTYPGGQAQPVNAGSYAVNAVVVDANYDGSTSDTLVIGKAAPVVIVSPYSLTYDGGSHSATGGAAGVKGEMLAGLNLAATTHTAAGSYNDTWVFTDTTGNYLNASGAVIDVIGKATPTIAVMPYSTTYDGAAHMATGTATGVKGEALAGLDLSGTAHTNAGTYNDTWNFADPTGNYATASGQISDVIAKATPTIAVTPYSISYDGTAHTATGAATGAKGETLAGLDLSGTTHTNAGAYNDTWNFTDATGNYASTSGAVADAILKATPTITVTPYSLTFDGAAHTATGVATGAKGETLIGLDLTGTTHTNAGTYNDTWTFTDLTGNYLNVSGVVTDSIAKATASVTIGSLVQWYDGAPKVATATTSPAGLNVSFTYDGVSDAPIYPGSHVVSATVSDSNYAATASGTLEIRTTALVNHAPVILGLVQGSIQVESGETMTLSGSVSTDLLVPGSPSVTVTNGATYGSTIDANGSATPDGYAVTLGSSSVLRHVVRRVDAIAMPVVVAPPTPSGTRDVSLTSSSGSIGDPTTLRNLSLSGKAGAVQVPPGTYGSLSVGGGASLVLGVAGATDPVVYNLQGLTISGGATLQIVGPVTINLAKGPSLNGSSGTSAHAEWLTIYVAGDNVTVADNTTLNGNVVFYGTIIDPTGTITLNGKSDVYGRIVADQLTINGNAALMQAP